MLKLQVANRTTKPNCSMNTPAAPTTTTTTTISPQTVFDLSAQSINKIVTCKNNETTIKVLTQYTIFVIDSFYGTTQSPQCNSNRLVKLLKI